LTSLKGAGKAAGMTQLRWTIPVSFHPTNLPYQQQQLNVISKETSPLFKAATQLTIEASNNKLQV